MIAARSVSVTVRGMTSGGGSGGGAINARWASASTSADGSIGGHVDRSGPGEPRSASRTGLAPEQADPLDGVVRQTAARVAVGPVEQQPRPELRLGIGDVVAVGGLLGGGAAAAAASPGS